MVLDARHRSSIYAKLSDVLGEDDANALMSAFPVAEAEELVTKEFLRAELVELRSDLRSELQSEIVGLRSELQSEITGLRSELQGEIAGLRIEMHDLLRGQTTRVVTWVVSTMLAGMAMAAAIGSSVG